MFSSFSDYLTQAQETEIREAMYAAAVEQGQEYDMMVAAACMTRVEMMGDAICAGDDFFGDVHNWEYRGTWTPPSRRDLDNEVIWQCGFCYGITREAKSYGLPDAHRAVTWQIDREIADAAWADNVRAG